MSMVEPVAFREHFWGTGDGGIEVLLGKLRTSVQDTEAIVEIFQARAQVEEEYGKALESFTQRYRPHISKISTPSVSRTIEKLVNLTSTISRAHSQYASKIQDDVVVPFSDFLDETQRSMRKQCESDFEKANKALEKETAQVTKTAREYVARSKDVWKAHDSVGKHEKTDKLRAEADKAEAEYRGSLTRLDKAQDAWEDKMSHIQDAVQTSELDRIHLYRVVLTRTTETQIAILSQFTTKVMDAMRKAAVEGLDPISDCNQFIEEYGTGTDRPRRCVFQNASDLVRTGDPFAQISRPMSIRSAASMSRIAAAAAGNGFADERDTVRKKSGSDHKLKGEGGFRTSMENLRSKSSSSLFSSMLTESVPPLPPLPSTYTGARDALPSFPRSSSRELLRALGLSESNLAALSHVSPSQSVASRKSTKTVHPAMGSGNMSRSNDSLPMPASASYATNIATKPLPQGVGLAMAIQHQPATTHQAPWTDSSYQNTSSSQPSTLSRAHTISASSASTRHNQAGQNVSAPQSILVSSTRTSQASQNTVGPQHSITSDSTRSQKSAALSARHTIAEGSSPMATFIPPMPTGKPPAEAFRSSSVPLDIGNVPPSKTSQPFTVANSQIEVPQPSTQIPPANAASITIPSTTPPPAAQTPPPSQSDSTPTPGLSKQQSPMLARSATITSSHSNSSLSNLQLPIGITPPRLPTRQSSRPAILVESHLEVCDQASQLLNPTQPWTRFYCILEKNYIWLYNRKPQPGAEGELPVPVGSLPIERRTQVEYGISAKAKAWARPPGKGKEGTCFTVTVVPNKRVVFDAKDSDLMCVTNIRRLPLRSGIGYNLLLQSEIKH
ncbi:hypothetical protein DFS34DRAFT_596757 [Phlyctochytrium arcticum]|nr:hypothetical protein DFS34DRAFT_596757 [Phlyctochytrium arcticum]